MPVGAPTRRQRGRWVRALAITLLVLGTALLFTLSILAHRASSILRARVINTLSTRFQGRVELPEFEVSAWHGFEATGRGLRIFSDPISPTVPLFSVGEFRFHTAWWDVLRSPMHVNQVTVSDFVINLPPHHKREAATGQAQEGERGRKQKIEIIADRVNVERAELVLRSDKPGKAPLVFHLADLELRSVGAGQPVLYHAALTNPVPVGSIDTTGSFGPLNVDHAGSTPIRGNYTFSHADLATIKGIGGTLSSAGSYNGTLEHIAVDGTTDTPDFSLSTGHHPVPLRTRFHALVDGTNGDTSLQPVDAYLRHSHIVARGSVMRAPGGHHITLDITVGPNADIGDFLDLAVKTRPVLMHGALALVTRFDLPPGRERVPDRMRLNGQFSIHNATFSNPRFQSDVTELSLRGSGKPQDAKLAAEEHWRIDSDMHGDFTLANAKLAISGLHYNVPGADIGMDGVYSMDGKTFDFHGKVRLQAEVSQMVSSWWRQLLLLPLDGILKRNGAGTEIPVRISGTEGAPKFGLDFDRGKQRR